MSALSSENVSKSEFLTGKDVSPEKDLLEKAATIKRFEYLPWGSALKKQTDIIEKQYQGSNKFFMSAKKEEPVTIKKESAITEKSKLMYDIKYSFSDFSNIGKYYVLSFTTKYNDCSHFIID